VLLPLFYHDSLFALIATMFATLSNLSAQLFIVAICASSIVAAIPNYHDTLQARRPTPSKRSMPSNWKRHPTPTNPTHATPSKRHIAKRSSPSGWKHGHAHANDNVAAMSTEPDSIHKRGIAGQEALATIAAPEDFDFSAYLCPGALSACQVASKEPLVSNPISLTEWNSIGFECVDFTTDLRSCGGCSALDASHDCTTIAGASSVSCLTGNCRINTCKPGYMLSKDNSTCVHD